MTHSFPTRRSSDLNGAELAGDFNTFDIARIEVLKGPQGTLYGASSLGGLLKFVTNEPTTDRIEGKALGGAEFTDGGDASYRGAGMIKDRKSTRLNSSH